MSKVPPDVFDFDFWVNAYKEDPEGYDELAKAFIHSQIDKMTDDEEKRNKLKGLYWQITHDPDVRNEEDPVVRAQIANTKMWLKVNELQIHSLKLADEVHTMVNEVKDD